MTTITLEKEKNLLQKTKFQDEYELYEYLKEYLLVEKLHEMEDEESSGPMEIWEAMKFLDGLK